MKRKSFEQISCKDQLLKLNLYLSRSTLAQLQATFLQFSRHISKHHINALSQELTDLLNNTIPQHPSEYLPSLLVYAFVNKFYNIKTPHIQYLKTPDGVLLKCAWWYSTLLRNPQGKDFAQAIKQIALQLTPNLVEVNSHEN